jgi:dTDP-4-dehydrorhamnose 3,5-epimerase
MKIIGEYLNGVLLIEDQVYYDDRGYFYESWNERELKKIIDKDFVQDNVSYSPCKVVRGLHFQDPHPQGKLIRPVKGTIRDVVVDIRKDSPTFGEHHTFFLSNDSLLYVPEGFAHGFEVLSDSAIVSYKCTDYYSPESQYTLKWNDPDIGIQWTWNHDEQILSDKDMKGMTLKELMEKSIDTDQDIIYTGC